VRIDGSEIGVAMTILPMRDGDGTVSNIAYIATPMGRSIRQVNVPGVAADPARSPLHE